MTDEMPQDAAKGTADAAAWKARRERSRKALMAAARVLNQAKESSQEIKTNPENGE